MRIGCLALLAGAGFLVNTHASAAVLTPEDRAGAGGLVANPNSNFDEYYYGEITAGQSALGEILGFLSGQTGTLAWFKYVSDGHTPVVFDTFGSNFGFGGGPVFGGGPDAEIAVFDAEGNFVADNAGVKAPAGRDSTAEYNQDPKLPAYPDNFRQPKDPHLPVYRGEPDQNPPAWYGSNNQGLAQISFVDSPEAHPWWSPSSPSYDPNADWDEYAILPAGTYFVAVTGYSTYFGGGNPADATAIDVTFASYGIDSSAPFSALSFHPHSGVFVLNTRLAGDMDLDGDVDRDDLEALLAKIAQYADTDGIAPEGMSGGEWIGLPSDTSNPAAELQRFDLTGNSRIDLYDRLQFTRFTGISVPGDTDIDGDIDDFDLINAIVNYTGSLTPGVGGKTIELGDTDGDQDVDDFDLINMIVGYTGSFAPPPPVTTVPEPRGAALLLGGVAMALLFPSRTRARARVVVSNV